MKTKADEVKRMLLTTKREGMQELIDFMEKRKFFTSPGSIKFHGNYEGGLLDHSVNVYALFVEMCHKFELKIDDDTQLIVSLLHDLCKAGLYNGDEGNYSFNHFVGIKGHAKYSIGRIERFIELKPIEKEIIKYHMGMYGACGRGQEYELSELVQVFNNKIVKLFYFCDDMCTQFVDEKK